MPYNHALRVYTLRRSGDNFLHFLSHYVPVRRQNEGRPRRSVRALGVAVAGPDN